LHATNAELEARYTVTLDRKHHARCAGRRPRPGEKERVPPDNFDGEKATNVASGRLGEPNNSPGSATNFFCNQDALPWAIPREFPAAWERQSACFSRAPPSGRVSGVPEGYQAGYQACLRGVPFE
jgi:hypothetical protein